MDIDDERLRAEFEPVLCRELEELETSSRATAEDRKPVELDQQSVGRLARMDAMQVQAMAKAADRRRQARGARIQAALRRMAQGEFGYCLSCGEFIGVSRLRVDPTTAQCVQCAAGHG